MFKEDLEKENVQLYNKLLNFIELVNNVCDDYTEANAKLYYGIRWNYKNFYDMTVSLYNEKLLLKARIEDKKDSLVNSYFIDDIDDFELLEIINNSYYKTFKENIDEVKIEKTLKSKEKKQETVQEVNEEEKKEISKPRRTRKKKIVIDDENRITYGDIVLYKVDDKEDIQECKITSRENYIEDVLFRKAKGEDIFYIDDFYKVHYIEIVEIKKG